MSQSGTESVFAPIVHLLTTSVADTAPSPCTTPPMAFVRVDLENYDVVSSGIDVFQQAMESEPSTRCPESHVSTDTPSDQQYLSQKDGHDDDLFSKGLPCTGKEISDAGLEGFGNTPTSVDDANWMPIAPFP